MWLLRVNNGTQDFNYTIDILQNNIVRQESTSGREVQLGSVSVSLCTTFLGLTDPCALPKLGECKGYRALLSYNNNTVIDGVIYRVNASYQGKDDVWDLEIVNEAIKDFYDKLKEIELIKLAHNGIEFETFINNIGLSSSLPIGASKPKWYPIKGIWNTIRSVLSAKHGITVESYTALYPNNSGTWDIETFTLAQDFANGQEIKFAEGYLLGSYDSEYESWRNPYPVYSVPKWSAFEFFEFYADLLGLRLIGEYKAFPDCKIRIECFQEINANRTTEAELDSALLASTTSATETVKRPFELRNTEPLYTDFATSYTNNLGEVYPASPSVPFPTPINAQPIPAVYGYENYRVETSDKKTRPKNEDLLDLKTYLPFYIGETLSTVTNSFGTQQLTTGIPVVQEGKDEVYIGCWLDTNPTTNMLVQRKWIDNNGYEVYNAEHWATNILNLYPVSRNQRCVAQADFCSEGLDLRVQNQQVGFLGDKWIVESFAYSPEGQYYEGVSLLKVNDIFEWVNAGRQPVTPPINATTSLVCTLTNGGLQSCTATLMWDRSTTPAIATHYEIQYFNPFAQEWTNSITQVAVTTGNTYVSTFITEYDSLLEVFRVRSIAGTNFSDWVEFPFS